MGTGQCGEIFDFLYPVCYLLRCICFNELSCTYSGTKVSLAIGGYLHIGVLENLFRFFDEFVTSGLTTRCVLLAFGLYPKSGPIVVTICHHWRSVASLPAAVASSANHTCLALGSASLSLSIRGRIARAYIAIANGSPVQGCKVGVCPPLDPSSGWVVPSVESISPSPVMKSLIGAW